MRQSHKNLTAVVSFLATPSQARRLRALGINMSAAVSEELERLSGAPTKADELRNVPLGFSLTPAAIAAYNQFPRGVKAQILRDCIDRIIARFTPNQEPGPHA